MKNMLRSFGIALVTTLLIFGCQSGPSLQKYYVDAKENDNFISLDLPSSLLQLKDTDVSEDIQGILETIEKVNFLALQRTETNKELYTEERGKVREILKKPKYKELIRFNQGSANVSVNFLGKEEAIDEVVIFGSDSEKGFAIVRVIGNNMNPSDILRLSQELKLDGDSDQMKQLSGLLGNIY